MPRHTGGWLKLYRSLLDHPAAADIESIGLLSWLLMSANHNPSRAKFGTGTIDILPGQVLTGRKEMATKLQCSESMIERRLKWLATCGTIEQRSNSYGRVITILNWDDYQSVQDSLEQNSDNDRTTIGQRSDNDRTLSGEGKKERKKEEREAPLSNSPKPKAALKTKTLTQTWEPDDPLARIFSDLIAIPAYAEIFDLKKEQTTVLEHMKRHALSLPEMERITNDLRHYCDGYTGEIKSPRGKLNTFVQSFAERKAKATPPTSPKSAGQRSPVLETMEDVRRHVHGN